MNKHVFPNSVNAATSLSEELISWMNEDKSRDFYIAVSGGSTPAILFHIWMEQFIKRIDWNRLHIFWVDERCVDPRSADSNYGMTKKVLLDHVPIPSTNVHRIIGEVEPDYEAAQYSKRVKEVVPGKSGYPQFDLILLGIGDDGHTASIFPNRFDLLADPEVYAVAHHPQTGQARVTLTGSTIRHARRIVFFVTGESKATVLRSIFTGDEYASLYPSFKIAEAVPHAEFYLDEAAAKLI